MKCVYKIALGCHLLHQELKCLSKDIHSLPTPSPELGNSCPQRIILWLMLGAGKSALFSPEAFCHLVSFCDSRMMYFEVQLLYSRAYCHFNHSTFKTSISRMSLFQCDPLNIHSVWTFLWDAPLLLQGQLPGWASLRRASVPGLMLSCHCFVVFNFIFEFVCFKWSLMKQRSTHLSRGDACNTCVHPSYSRSLTALRCLWAENSCGPPGWERSEIQSTR